MIEIDGIVYAKNPCAELVRVRYVKPLDNYRLFLTFTNGKQKIFDMSSKLEQGVFRQLKDNNLFYRVYVDHGTVAWNDEIDICPDSLYYDSVSAPISDDLTN